METAGPYHRTQQLTHYAILLRQTWLGTTTLARTRNVSWLFGQNVFFPETIELARGSFVPVDAKAIVQQSISFWFSFNFVNFCRFFMDRSDNAILRRRFGNDMPSVADISKKISLMLTNTHYSLNGPRPLSPKVIEVGGVHIKAAKPIDEVSNDKLSLFNINYMQHKCTAHTRLWCNCFL